MAYLKRKTIHGQTYWYLVESRRIGGKVKTVNLAYLGKPDDILRRIGQADRPFERLKSFSHGGVAVLLSLADRLGLVELIDRHIRPARPSEPTRRLLSVGQTLLLATIGRALHPTSKRGWAGWACGTTWAKLWSFDPNKITSQFFWDQMDRLPAEALTAIQAELGRRVLDRFDVSAESLFYDVTNFFTFIDSRNTRCDLPQRGKNKQKRNDLRQFQLGMLVSRDGWVPLLAKLYRGNHNDVTTFPRALEAIADQCDQVGIDAAHVTLVADKGNVSQKNWRLLDASGFGYVVSVVPSYHKDWACRPPEDFTTCEVPDLGQMRVLRGQAIIAERERTVVVIDSPTLRDGQLRGLQQQMQPILKGLTHIQNALQTATRRRRRDVIERQVRRILSNARRAGDLIRYELTEWEDKDGFWKFDWWVDADAFYELRDRRYGRRILATNRSDWPTDQIIWAYWGQSEAELVFRQLKDPQFLALRPQYHWTDQKIEVHSFCCVVGYLLAALLRRHARQMGSSESIAALLDRLNNLRMVLRTECSGHVGRPRVHWQLEETDADTLGLYRSLVRPEYELGPTL